MLSPTHVNHPAGSPRLVVLVVDDNPDVLDSTSCVLQAMGFETLLATSPLVAIDLARKLGTLHALVTDFSMPDMNGGELISRIAALHPAVRAVITSGLDSASVRYGLTHPTHVLPKPYDVNALFKALTR